MRRRRLVLRREAVRVLRAKELEVAVGGKVEATEECPSAYTYCYHYCTDFVAAR